MCAWVCAVGNIVLKSDIQATILAGVVLTIRCARQQGSDPRFVAGVLAIAEHNAHALGLDWPGILDDLFAALGDDAGGMFDVIQSTVPSMIISGCVDRGG